MMFPVVIKSRAYVEPAASIHYLVAENGVFQVRDTILHRAVTRVDTIPSLLPEYEHVRIKFPRLSRAHVEDIIALFEEVFRRYRGESVVFLFYHAEAREFRVGVPPQTLPGRRRLDGSWLADLAVRYGGLERPPGFVLAGSIHSHAELPACPSGQDCADERWEDGLHLVFGSFASKELSVSASFVANGVRFRLDPADVLEPHDRPRRPARPEWLARVRPERDADDRMEHEHHAHKTARRAHD